MAQEFDGAVAFVSENFGESELAERFGVARYPAVFVGDVLVAKPKDFGFFGTSGSQGSGRYTPWLTEESQARFRTDMQRLIAQAVRGELSIADAVEADTGQALTKLPELDLEDLFGGKITNESLRGSVTLVDFWATWCPPCIKALPALRELQDAHPSDLQIVGVAIESRAEDVRKVASDLELSFPTVLGTPALAIEFGDLVSVPTAFLFDRQGKLVKTFYGAPPELERQLHELVKELIERPQEDEG